MYDLRSDSMDLDSFAQLVSYFGYANHQSDVFWDYATNTFLNIGDNFDPDSLADLISGYSHCQRGSNQFWNMLVTKFVENKESVSINSKILVLKSLLVVDYYDKHVYEQMANEILDGEVLNSSVRCPG